MSDCTGCAAAYASLQVFCEARGPGVHRDDNGWFIADYCVCRGHHWWPHRRLSVYFETQERADLALRLGTWEKCD